MNSRRFILSIYILCIAAYIFANTSSHYYFRSLGLSEGLSHSTVNVIYQDRIGFMWFGTKDGLNRFDGNSFRVFKKENSGLGNNFITAICEDNEGKMWIGTDAGVYIYDPMLESFEAFDTPIDKLGDTIKRAITCLAVDPDGNIWISSDYQGLFCYDKETRKLISYTEKIGKKVYNVTKFWFDSGCLWVSHYEDNLYYSVDKSNFKIFKDSKDEEPFNGDVINASVKGLHNCFYIASSKGLYEINQTSGKVRQLLEGYVRDICFRTDTELWVGTEQGIYIYDLNNNSYTQLMSPAVDERYALSDNAIYSIFKDREDGIWIGSYFGGINYLPKEYSYFEKYYPRDDLRNFGKRVREICSGNDSTLWIGTEDKGLFNFNPKNRVLTPFCHPLLYNNIHGLCLDGDYLWVGTFSGGLNKIDLKTRNMIHYTKNDKIYSLNSNNVFSIYKTSTSDVWIGTTSGLMKYNREIDGFISVPELNNVFVYDILEDVKGRLWIATYSEGLYCYDLLNKTFRQYKNSPQDSTSLSYDKVIGLFEDSCKQLWIMTQGAGVCRYIPETDNFIRYDMNMGLPSNIVYEILEDNSGMLWLSTNDGLVELHPETGIKHIYTTVNGLIGNQFNYKSGYKDKDGTLYFGSINGFISFNPSTFILNKQSSPLVLTDFFLHNKRLSIGDKDIPLERSIVTTDKIMLNADQNSFSIKPAVLSYQAPSSNIILYKLEGFDKEWYQLIKDNSLINYSNLPYGHYVLHIKGANSDGVWTPQQRLLQIDVLPPFYLSWVAYCLYFLFGILFLLGVVYYFRKRSIRKHLQAMEVLKYEKERELYTAKIDFFTNVAHEIRTPLTLIKSPLENVLANTDLNNVIKEDLEIMDLNTNRLLDLVNQLLDFRKTETKGFKLSLMRCDVSELILRTFKRFTPLAREKGLSFKIQMPDTIYAFIDKEGFTKIVSNLFTNAIKYSMTYINVDVKVSENNHSLIVIISNNGNIVPLEMREDIFRPFIQCRDDASRQIQGTGIGLALARSLAELHGGTLKMDDSMESNNFILTIPLKDIQTASLKDNEEIYEFVPVEEDVIEDVSLSEMKYTLLIVEDNFEMRRFLVKELSKSYKVLSAGHGVEALSVLKDSIVNLVVSDVMMPEMDGLELCNQIKTNLDYCHIPVILLTAKTALQSRIEGLNIGADAYVDKPFSMEYLKVCISNLLKNREQLRATFIHTPFVPTNSIAISKADEDFLKKLNEIVQANLQNPEFSLLDMANLLCMSRSSLNRKLKGLLDVTPNDYVRIERLKKAAILLRDGNCKINEVCYMVGFNTPSYFAKCFQKQFGVLPKDFVCIK